MRQTECKPNVQQRGETAHIHQHDKNHNMQNVNVQERESCNEIIHDKEIDHESKYDDFLKEQKEQRDL
ncbi:unnamed protein product [Adineta steineri]|uniref:Uncharacterized protein n=1 Tax=Adineta steineri TaxID=433720 RepID=A0A814PZP7_9BILA|nr:unnamed protein product [Adineta steineri]CAF4148365.1 unnamed protein product [Adineta steineri]